MKIIDENTLIKIFDRIKIDIKDVKYYKSGKCSDIYIYNGKLIKILKWYIKNDDINKIESKFNSKINFILYLNNNNFNCIKLYKHNNNYFDVFVVDGQCYVIYFMERLDEGNKSYTEENVAQLLTKLHSLSSKYNYFDKNISWKEEFYSVYDNCENKRLKDKLKEYYKKIDTLKISVKNYGFIHYDSNKNNYVFSENALYLIDFDTMCFGFYLMDIANYLFSLFNINMIKGMFMELDEFQKTCKKILLTYKSDEFSLDDLNLFFNYRLAFLYSLLYSTIDDLNVKNKIEYFIFDKNIEILQ